jgi:hypothetical protein
MFWAETRRRENWGEISRFVRAKMLRFGYEAGKKQPEFWENARARLVVVARCMAWAWPERRREGERKRPSGEGEEMASLPRCGFTHGSRLLFS